jgi:hypothetical protein
MDIEGAIGVLTLLLHWRIALCVAGSTATAILAVQSVPWLTGLQGIAIALLGMGFGAMWDASAGKRAPVSEVPDAQTSTAVASTAAGIVGATWGLFSATSIQSFFAGVVVFAAGAWWWVWYAGSHHRWVSSRRARLCIAVALGAYVLGTLAGHRAVV